jgi:anion-transporting  ArsA/GET3 family ATPase
VRPPELLDRRLIFVTGKGGVGKTTVAAGLALLAAQRGKRTLVCEVDAKGNLADFYESGPSSFDAREIQPGLFTMAMDTERSLDEYLRLFLRVPVMGRIGPIARMFDFVATAAPGVKEILTVGKLCYEVRERHYDLVVVDASPTGHVVGQLAAPQAINSLVQVGLIRSQTDWILEILSDPDRTGLLIVTTPEEMPVNETIELSSRVAKETTVQLAGIVVNRVLPELFGRGEEEVFDRLSDPSAKATVDAAMGGDAGPLLAGARLAVTLRRTRAVHLDHLRESVDPALPLLYVPYLFARTHGLRSTRAVAESLAAELGY